jgi:hypothetical protein
MIIDRKNINIDIVKEYDWELFPYRDGKGDYCIWADHHDKRSTIVKLSSRDDYYESIDLTSKEAIDELITKLNKAKEVFK